RRLGIGRRAAIWALVFCAPAPPSPAQESSRVDTAIERRRESIQSRLDREGVTRNWFGFGETLAGHGIRFEAAMTLFGQAAASGHDSAAFFGGKLDGLLRADLAEFGLWAGLSLTVHPEYNFGEAANGFGGAILPLNSALQLPGTTPGKRYDTSSLFFRQPINDTFSLIAGKTSLSDAIRSPFCAKSAAGPSTASSGWRTRFQQAERPPFFLFPYHPCHGPNELLISWNTEGPSTDRRLPSG
ncbi:MAG: hypothetical protein O3C21_17780, partial [Verrucomicrobia bacterium]|nr:hypothetical protein [Verrucomicrobiota bacterium]